MRISKFNILVICISLMLCFVLPIKAHENAQHEQVTYEQSSNEQLSNLPTKTLHIQSLQVIGKLPVLANGITDLKFNEIFNMPVGPRGMEPSSKLLSLNSKLVRIVGYMAKQETPTPGLFIMTPLAVNMGDEDDKFADDMPANSIFVHVDNSEALVQYVPGLISLIGVLSVGNVNEVDGRISYVQIKLDSTLSGLVATENQTLN
jgi:hypothetical protein